MRGVELLEPFLERPGWASSRPVFKSTSISRNGDTEFCSTTKAMIWVTVLEDLNKCYTKHFVSDSFSALSGVHE